MTTPLLDAWTPEQRQTYRRGIVTFNNRLAETGLFTDEALIRLIEAHPRDAYDVITMGRDATDRDSWAAGDDDGVSAAELLQAAKQGRIWINVRRAMNMHPEYRAVFDRLLAEFQRETRGPRILKAHGGILISAPQCQVFYHCDKTDTMLWHVRGTKTMYLYPTHEPYLSDRVYEGLVLKETLEDIPYTPEFEMGATAVTLEPGMSVSWPLHAPHRVVNGDSFNVSVTIEYTTVDSMLTNGVFVANGVLRRRFGLQPQSRRTPGWLKPAYWAASKGLQRLAAKTDAYRSHGRKFDVDLSAPECVRWKPGFEPAADLAEAA